jgi:hypothetical protein
VPIVIWIVPLMSSRRRFAYVAAATSRRAQMMSRIIPSMERRKFGDPLRHTQKMRRRLQETMQHLREDIEKVDEPQLKAMFETSAEVLGGLVKAFGTTSKKARALGVRSAATDKILQIRRGLRLRRGCAPYINFSRNMISLPRE